MQQCSRREYHKRRKSVMKRQNDMRKQRGCFFSSFEQSHFGKRFLRLEGEPLG